MAEEKEIFVDIQSDPEDDVQTIKKGKRPQKKEKVIYEDELPKASCSEAKLAALAKGRATAAANRLKKKQEKEAKEKEVADKIAALTKKVEKLDIVEEKKTEAISEVKTKPKKPKKKPVKVETSEESQTESEEELPPSPPKLKRTKAIKKIKAKKETETEEKAKELISYF